MFRNLQEKLYSPDKFYDLFLCSVEGKKAFDSAYQLFTIPKETNLFVDYIINAMQDWLFNQLTDDEMNSAYTLFESLEESLKNLILNSIH